MFKSGIFLKSTLDWLNGSLSTLDYISIPCKCEAGPEVVEAGAGLFDAKYRGWMKNNENFNKVNFFKLY